MSTARLVPETRSLSGDDAWHLLRQIGWGRLCKDSFRRLRVADGFSHARSLAFLTSLVAIQGLIGAVGLASALHKGAVSGMIITAVRDAVPSPAGQILTTAATQAHRVAACHEYGAVLIGLIGALIGATSAFGQLERGLNRLYGIEQDRPTLKKYGLALLFTLSVGVLIAIAFVCLAFGRDLVLATNNGLLTSTWSVARWPLGLGLIGAAVTIVLRWSPKRRQPHLSWLAFGSGASILLWTLATGGLGLFYRSSSSFGKTYGPLAGIVALLIWSFLSSSALLFGAAISAQLEAVRAGVPIPEEPLATDTSHDPPPTLHSIN